MSGGPTNCKFVQRKDTSLRTRAVHKNDVYRKFWTESEVDGRRWTEEDWDEAVRVLQDGCANEIGEGFKMVKTKAGELSIRAPNGRRSKYAQDIFEMVDQCFNQMKERHKGVNAALQDEDGIKEMVGDMVTDTDSPYRSGLILTDKTKQVAQQRKLQEYLLAEYESDPLAIATYNCKDGIHLKFTKAAKEKAGQNSEGHLAKAVCAKAQTVVPNSRCTVTEDGAVEMKKQQICLLYDSLKDFQNCSRVVVITGEMGGRGVSYHSSSNDRILTDMFASIDLPANRQIAAHGEGLIQILGRLNTIETLGDACPDIRLWAPQPVHEFHKLCLNTVMQDAEAVQNTEDYRKGLQDTFLYNTGGGRIAATRPKFRRYEHDLRHGEIAVELGCRKKRPRCGQSPWDPLRPEHSHFRNTQASAQLENGARAQSVWHTVPVPGTGRGRQMTADGYERDDFVTHDCEL